MAIHQMIWSLDNFYGSNPPWGVTFETTRILILKQKSYVLFSPPKVIVKFVTAKAAHGQTFTVFQIVHGFGCKKLG